MCHIENILKRIGRKESCPAGHAWATWQARLRFLLSPVPGPKAVQLWPLHLASVRFGFLT